MLRLPPLEFRSPSTLEEAFEALGQDGARLVAGGTDLWPNMKRRHQQADVVVSLMGVEALRGIRHDEAGTTIGATTPLSAIVRDAQIRERYPAFARAVASISSAPLRNMGTLGGNLCVDTRCTYYNQTEEWRCAIDYCLKEAGSICWVATKSPRCWAHSASDTAPILCALGAMVTLAGADGEREIPVADLYRDDGIDFLDKGDDEILTRVFIPGDASADRCDSAFWKLRRRGSIDFAVLSVAAVVWRGDDEVVSRSSLYLGAVGSAPLAVGMDELPGSPLGPEQIEATAQRARKVSTPLDNTDFAPGWRGKMVQAYTAAALSEIAGLQPQCAPPRHNLLVV